MAREDLIKAPMWENYSENLNARVSDPKFLGEIDEMEAESLGAKLVTVEFGHESCGDAVKLSWAVDPKTDRILKSVFKSFGCGSAIASSDVMAELTEGKTVDQALDITNLQIEQSLRDHPSQAAFPSQKMHCSVMASDIIREAVAKYRGVDPAELYNNEIVCDCAQVKLSTIKTAIKVNRLERVEQVSQYTKAGAFCGECIGGKKRKKDKNKQHYLTDILYETHIEEAKESIEQGNPPQKFPSLSLAKKQEIIIFTLESIIAKELDREYGGSIDLYDIVKEGNYLAVYIEYYQGKVKVPNDDILKKIRQRLRKLVNPDIKVFSYFKSFLF